MIHHSYKFIFLQLPMIWLIFRGLVREIIPTFRDASPKKSFPKRNQVIQYSNDHLLKSYLQWCGASKDRYEGSIPPHFFSKICLPLLTKQLLETKYKLSTLVNSACHLKRHKTGLRSEPLNISSEVLELNEENGRANIKQRISIYQGSDRLKVEIISEAFFRTGKSTKKNHRNVINKFNTKIGFFNTSKNDGLKFAFLTGDFNPIHFFGFIAKLSPFKGMILHGYASLARTFEIIQNQNNQNITEFKVNFVKPVRIPSKNNRVFIEATSKIYSVQKFQLQSENELILLDGFFKI